MNRKVALADIRSAAKTYGSKKTLAEALGYSRPTIHNKLKQENGFTNEELIAAAKALGLDANSSIDESAEDSVLRGRPTDDFITVPRMATELSGGDGSFLDDGNVIGHLLFTKQWVKEKLGFVDTRSLCVVGVVGDSMEPTIHQGDDLMIDTAVNRMTDNAIYAMQWDGALIVKRLQRLMDGLVIISDNPAYKDQTIDRKQIDRLRIVGRVRWIGKVI
jgi:phage repressor protein C with HTH and peptisase S24 domain